MAQPSPTQNMAFVPGGTFLMGSNDFYPEERPVHRVTGDDFWVDRHPVTVAEFRRFVKETACCAPWNPRVTSSERSFLVDHPAGHIPSRVIKGGSHLGAANYCLRYRPAARHSETVETSTGHIDFRCVERSVNT